jgi:hypothetical protein
MPAAINYTPGQKIGDLVFVRAAPKTEVFRRAIFICKCGKEFETRINGAKSGNTKSCGCMKFIGLSQLSHGKADTPIYRVWASMLQRCTNPKNSRYADYGGRGITVCERWLKFEHFLADMGPRPDGMTLERERGNEGYEPGNCVWTTYLRQANNTRRNSVLEYEGRRQTVSEWATEFGLPYNTLFSRVYRLKWPIEKALKTPSKPSYQR